MKYVTGIITVFFLGYTGYIIACGYHIAHDQAVQSNTSIASIAMSSVAPAYMTPAFPLK